jgi:hypothetical protein
MKRRIDKRAEEIEESHGRKLTNRQKEFAKHFVDGTHSNAECARLAGYTDTNGVARIQAHKLLDSSLFPHVAEVHPLSSPHLYLFGGDQGRGLVKHGLRTGSLGSGSGETGTMVPCLWSGELGSGLMDRMLEISRVGLSGKVNAGVGSGSGSGDDGESGRGSVTWPGPGV